MHQLLLLQSRLASDKELPMPIKTKSHPEMVGDMSRMTLNFDLS